MAPKTRSMYMFRSSVKQNLPRKRSPTKQLPKPSTHRKMADLDGKMWHTDIEKMFIDIMIEQINKGKTLPFGRRIWSEIRAKLNERGNRNFTSKQCREKYQRIRRSFNHFTRLMRQKGFAFDAETNTVIADEETWQNYLLADKNAKKFRKKGVANYMLLALLFNKPSANSSCGSNSMRHGYFLRSSKNRPSPARPKARTKKPPSPAGSSRGSNRLSKVSGEFEAKKELARVKCDHYTGLSSVFHSTCTSPHPTDLCMNLLNELIHEISIDTYFEAIRLWVFDEQLQWAFIRMSAHDRRLWLSKLLP
ncbi:uncharacterized protein LOC132191454 [Corylus avellana]|uniref:uncharacterized protein LOC132191454 n=1 Tax=Corylus avellana TaxID=13451 RepID=UPI00286D1CBE|nr:uncharacterized protein LOC132191454 [Corylus avellana]